MKKNNMFDLIILMVLAIYVISPVDFMPGPIDDMIAILVYLAANKKKFHNPRLDRKDNDIEVIDVDGKEI